MVRCLINLLTVLLEYIESIEHNDTHGSESHGQVSNSARRKTNDATTTHEDFTSMLVLIILQISWYSKYIPKDIQFRKGCNSARLGLMLHVLSANQLTHQRMCAKCNIIRISPQMNVQNKYSNVQLKFPNNSNFFKSV